jgi:hypothetical protein
MKRFRYSKRCAAASSVATIVALAVFLWRAELASRYAGLLRADRQQEQDAVARMSAMSNYDEAHLSATRERARRFRLGLGRKATVEAALRCLGARWVGNATTSTDHGSYVTNTESFAMTSPTPADWPGIVGTVETLERLPGVGVQEMELKSEEGAGARSLEEATLVLVIQVARGAGADHSR